jgi:hypothetical protein
MVGRRRDERASLVRTSEWGFFYSSSANRSQMPDRTFPPPWSSEEHSAYYVVRDRNGQGLAYIYYENEPRRRSTVDLPRSPPSLDLVADRLDRRNGRVHFRMPGARLARFATFSPAFHLRSLSVEKTRTATMTAKRNGPGLRAAGPV